MASTSTFELMQQSLDSFTAQVVKSESLGFRSRLALQNVSQKLNLALETPGDTFQQVAWLVSLFFLTRSQIRLLSFPATLEIYKPLLCPDTFVKHLSLFNIASSIKLSSC